MFEIVLALLWRPSVPSLEMMAAMGELMFWLSVLFVIRRLFVGSWRRTETAALLEQISGLMNGRVSPEDPRWNQVLARAQSSDRVVGGEPFLASMVENLYSMNRLILNMYLQDEGGTMTVTADVLDREPEVAVTPATAAAPPPRYPRIVNRTPTEAPADREQLLYDLTDEALATRLWTDQNVEVSRAIGCCPLQVEIRIETLERLLDRRLIRLSRPH